MLLLLLYFYEKMNWKLKLYENREEIYGYGAKNKRNTFKKSKVVSRFFFVGIICED